MDVVWGGQAQVTGVSSSVRYALERAPVGFQVGGPGYHETAGDVVVPATLRTRAVLAGREVCVSSTDDGEVTMVTWKGPHHEVMRLHLGPPPPLARTLREFQAFRIHDRPDGCWLEPRAGSHCELVWEDVTVVVRDRGVVYVPDPRRARSLVPRGAGTPTRRGEIWRESPPEPRPGDGGLRASSYVVGSRAGAASVSIADSVDSDDETLLDWLDTLEVSWS